MILLYKDEDIELTMEYYEIIPGWGLHTKVKSWSLSKYKKFISIFGEILQSLSKEGITKLYAIPPTKLEEKWQMLFGFKDSKMRINTYKVMELYYGN